MVEERFWSKVEKTDTCWLWTGCINAYGYGHFKIDGRVQRAHRVSFELSGGVIAEGQQVDHICYVRRCVRPDHLRAITPKQNQENRSGAQANNSSGVRGVYWHKQRGKWHASVCHNGRHISVGLFSDLNEAKERVMAKRSELFTHNDADK